MQAFVVAAIFSFVVACVGSFVSLLLLSYAGTGFGFGDLRKDLLKLAIVALLVGLIDGAWTFMPNQHWSFYVITSVVHAIALSIAFFGDLSIKEAGLAAVGCRILYIIVGVTILAASQSTAPSIKLEVQQNGDLDI